jgi:hypothetical protein
VPREDTMQQRLQELFGQSFTEMRSLTSLPVFISETDLAPLSTTGERYLFSACSIPRFPGRLPVTRHERLASID